MAIALLDRNRARPRWPSRGLLGEPSASLSVNNFQGTYPLPEAQLDRFLVRLAIGYPSEEEELEMLFDRQERDPLDAVEPLATGAELTAMVAEARRVHVERRVARGRRKSKPICGGQG